MYYGSHPDKAVKDTGRTINEYREQREVLFARGQYEEAGRRDSKLGTEAALFAAPAVMGAVKLARGGRIAGVGQVLTAEKVAEAELPFERHLSKSQKAESLQPHIGNRPEISLDVSTTELNNQLLFNRSIISELPNHISSRQRLHVPPVIDGRSVLHADPEELLKGLLEGKFNILRQPKPGQIVVDFGEPIGEFWSKASGEAINAGLTNYGSVMYGKQGIHIVPANPNQW